MTNKFLYQGKEIQSDLGLDTYDFHARMYDPALGRTFQQDPLGEKYYPFSPYSWVANNPLIITDPTGMELDWSQLKGKENKEKREQFRKAFRELKKSGETGKAIVKTLKSKKTGKITLAAENSFKPGTFDGNKQMSNPFADELVGTTDIEGTINLNLDMLNTFGINPTDALVEEAVHAANYLTEVDAKGNNLDIDLKRGNDEFSAKAVVGQVEKEMGRKITQFTKDDIPRNWGRNAFSSKSTSGFYKSMKKWQKEKRKSWNPIWECACQHKSTSFIEEIN